MHRLRKCILLSSLRLQNRRAPCCSGLAGLARVHGRDGFQEAVRGFESNIVFSYRSYVSLFLLPTTIRVILDERQIPLVRLRHISAAGRCYEISAAGRCYEIPAAGRCYEFSAALC